MSLSTNTYEGLKELLNIERRDHNRMYCKVFREKNECISIIRNIAKHFGVDCSVNGEWTILKNTPDNPIYKKLNIKEK